MGYLVKALEAAVEVAVSHLNLRPSQPLPTYDSTVEWITELHAHQWDDAFDLPYHTHPVGAAMIYQRLYPEASDEEIQAVLLHDTKDDAGVTDDDLIEKRYSARTIWMVDMMSKERPKILTYEQRIEAIIETGDRPLMFAKLADNLHNRSRQMTGHLAQTDPERHARLIPKHTNSINMLCAALGLDPYEAISAIGPETQFAQVPGFEYDPFQQ